MLCGRAFSLELGSQKYQLLKHITVVRFITSEDGEGGGELELVPGVLSGKENQQEDDKFNQRRMPVSLRLMWYH